MRLGDRRRLRRDPLEYVEDLRRHSATEVILLPGGGWFLGDAEQARALLRDQEFNAGRSGFFGDLLPTRSAQVEVGHAVRDVLRAHLPDYRAALASAVAGLPSADRWPAAGTGWCTAVWQTCCCTPAHRPERGGVRTGPRMPEWCSAHRGSGSGREPRWRVPG